MEDVMAQLVDERLEGLDALAAQIDRAADAIARLKKENAGLNARITELQSVLGAGAKRLQGRTLDDVLGELEQLKGVERQWAAERKEIANRIEEMVAKLERLDG
jgi:chromosome segregation ATPase